MKVQFVHPQDRPLPRMVCEAEIVFEDEGMLNGTRLVGFTLWRANDGKLYVTFPARSFGTGSERRYFDFLRGSNKDDGGVAVRRVKTWIIDEYFRQEGANADAPAED